MRGVLADVVDTDDVLVGEPPHRLRFTHDPFAADFVESVGLDERERDVAVEQHVVGKEDALLAALTEEALDLIAATGEGLRVVGSRLRLALDWLVSLFDDCGRWGG